MNAEIILHYQLHHGFRQKFRPILSQMTKDDVVSVQQHEKEWDEIFDGIHDVVDACAFQDG